MTETLIQTFLSKQFIKTSDEGNIPNLQKTAKSLADKLRKKKSKIIPYTLVAIDPQIFEDDPVVAEVEKAIISNWKTFKNSVSQTKEKSTTYIRAVILDSLRLLLKDDELAAIIWHTSRDVINHYQLAGEQETISGFLQTIANQVEKSGQYFWSNNSLIIPSKPNIESDRSTSPKNKITTASVSEEKIEEYLLDGAQNSGWKSYSKNIGSNPRNPQHQHWAPHFAKQVSDGLAKEINSALTTQNKNLKALSTFVEEQVENSLSHIQPFLKQISEGLQQGAMANNKRSELLWWKQTLYSPSLDASYHSLNPIKAAILMATDLADLVAPIYPHSVDFLLMETLKDVHGKSIDDPKPFKEWIEEAFKLKEEEDELLKVLVNNIVGRKSFGCALANHLNQVSENDIFSETGIAKTSEVSLADLAVWIFHDLQAIKLATKK